jgi:hypothetical protein
MSSIRVGSHTPWGSADFAEELAPGIVIVCTPSHGGIHLDDERNAKVDLVWRNANGWYEEDCEANIVFATFFGELAGETTSSLERIHDQLHWAFPRAHAVVFSDEAIARLDRPTFDSDMAALQAAK